MSRAYKYQNGIIVDGVDKRAERRRKALNRLEAKMGEITEEANKISHIANSRDHHPLERQRLLDKANALRQEAISINNEIHRIALKHMREKNG